MFSYLGQRYAEIAGAARKNKDYEQAEAALHTALLLDPGNAELMKRTGNLLLTRTVNRSERKENLQQVLGWYAKAIHTCPVQGEFFSEKAYILKRLGKTEQVEQAYQDVLQLYPVHAFAWYRLADLYLTRKRYDEALRYFRRFLVLGKQRYLPTVLNRLSSAGLDDEDLQQAVPATAAFRRAFAAYLFAEGRTWPALHELEFAFTLEPTPENALAHVRGLSRSKDFIAALEQTQAYLERFPESLGLREQKARILERLGRRQEAVFLYRSLQRAVYTGRLSGQADRNKAAAYCIRAARLYAADQLMGRGGCRAGTGRGAASGQREDTVSAGYVPAPSEKRGTGPCRAEAGGFP